MLSEELAEATLYTSAEPCVMCTRPVYWLRELTGDDPENPIFDLPCREVLSRGQRMIDVVGPVLEDEAAAAHEGFSWGELACQDTGEAFAVAPLVTVPWCQLARQLSGQVGFLCLPCGAPWSDCLKACER